MLYFPSFRNFFFENRVKYKFSALLGFFTSIKASGRPFIKQVMSGRKLSFVSSFSHVNSVVTCHVLFSGLSKSIKRIPDFVER